MLFRSEVTVRSGRYGPFVKHGRLNASLPKGSDPDSLTLDEAVALLAAQAAKAKQKKPSKKGAAKKSAKTAKQPSKAAKKNPAPEVSEATEA